jgi:hypothetical protein
MAGIDLNKYYQTLISSGSDPVEAAQLAAYQYLDNPSGSITQIKQPAKWYTENDWLNYSAPDYLAAVNYAGEDPIANQVAEFVKSPNFTLPGISELARKNRDLFKGGDVYGQLKDLYDQKESARKSYEKQLETHEFSQFGLPDPTIRYGVLEREQNGKKYVPYKPAVEYVNKKQKDYYTKLVASGIDAKLAAQRTAMYQQKLVSEVENKITQAGLSPFVEKIAQLRKIKK